MTLKLNELRIGNWIQFMDEQPQQLTTYTLASLCQNPVALEFYRPIPIMRTGLNLMLNLKFVDESWFQHGFNFTVRKKNHWFIVDSGNMLRRVDYLHEIQNIFFAIYATEVHEYSNEPFNIL